MQSDSSLSFKVFLQENQEIRYFTIDSSVGVNFEYLYAKLQNVFPTLSNRNFVVNWIDSEGDKIVISSDDEFMIAITNMGNVKKLSVSIPEVKVEIIEDPIKIFKCSRKRYMVDSVPEHYNIICDSCNAVIRGFRYKCLICSDFDLCSNCEGARKHASHIMLRLPIPIKNFRCDTKGSQLGDSLDEFTKNSKSTKEYVKKLSKHSGESSEKRKLRPKRCRKLGVKSDFLDMFTSYMDDFTNLAGDMKLNTESGPKPPEAQKQSEAATQSEASTSQQKTSTPQSETSTPRPEASAPQPEVSVPQTDFSYVQNCLKRLMDNIPELMEFQLKINNGTLFGEKSSSDQTKANVPSAPKESESKSPTPESDYVNVNDESKSQMNEDSKSSLLGNISDESDDSGSDCIILKSSDMMDADHQFKLKSMQLIDAECENSPPINSYGWTLLDSEEPGDDEMITKQHKSDPIMESVTRAVQNSMNLSDTITMEPTASTNHVNVQPKFEYLTKDQQSGADSMDSSLSSSVIGSSYTSTEAQTVNPEKRTSTDGPIGSYSFDEPLNYSTLTHQMFTSPFMIPPTFPHIPGFSQSVPFMPPIPLPSPHIPFSSMVNVEHYNATDASKIPTPTTTVPQPVSTVPQSVIATPQSVTTIPQSVNTIPQTVTTIPQSVNTIPQSVNTIPQSVTPGPQSVPTVHKPFINQPQYIAVAEFTAAQAAAKNPHLAVPLRQMMDMGYGNEDGWLEQLLESRNGNINEVLDILSAVTRK